MTKGPAIEIPDVLPREAVAFFRQNPCGTYQLSATLIVQGSRRGNRLLLHERHSHLCLAEFTANGNRRNGSKR